MAEIVFSYVGDQGQADMAKALMKDKVASYLGVQTPLTDAVAEDISSLFIGGEKSEADADFESEFDGEVNNEINEPQNDLRVIKLQDFVAEFGDVLLQNLNASNPPVYQGKVRPDRQAIVESLNRKLFDAQKQKVYEITELLVNQGERAAILNGEMGTGKTTIGIAVAAVFRAEGYKRTLVLSPPHLVYKWRREILETVPEAKVWILNGPDTLGKLIQLRNQLGYHHEGPEFFIMGRVRMRMGFHWKPVYATRLA
ncbi:MAG: DEAD/DEAH box helicase family protein, partial [Saezia sp.]